MTDLVALFGVPGAVAVVTGAAAGIGQATAAVLSAAGASVVVADVDGDGAERVAATLSATGATAVARTVDVADPESVTRLVQHAVAELGGLDIMVNNAGVMVRRPALEISPEEFDRVHAVNLKGVLYGCQAAGRVMRRGGSIVNMLSEIIDRGTAETASYAAAKKGAEALTRTFAVELGPAGIRVNGVAPAWTVSAMTRRRGLDDKGVFDPERFAEVTSRLASLAPLGVVLEPEDVAHAVLFLVSPAARRISGQVMRVNSGSSMT
jgi:3-oxoacyl-[acyl-carrier protein] reductase